MFKFINKSIRRKLALFISTLIIFLVIITTIAVGIIYYNSLYSDFFQKNSMFAQTSAEIISNRYGSFYPLGYVEEFKESVNQIISENQDVKWFILAKIDGELLYDSLYPDKEGTLIQKEVIKQIKSDEPSIRRVRFGSKMLYEFTSPVINAGNNTHLYTVIFYVSDYELIASIGYMLIWLIAIAILFVTVSIFVTFKISSVIINPLNKLVDASKKVSSGEYNTNVEINREDEVGELAKAFNIMTADILASFERIEEQNREIKQYSEHLEDMVKERTLELNRLNKDLSRTNEQMLREFEMAERVQQSIIPTEKDFPRRNELSFASKYSSMESIGGDLYDIIPIANNIYGFLIADVSGHGVPAALITSMAKVSFNSNSNYGIEPAEVCRRVNEEIYKLIGDFEYYLTAYYGILNLETGEFTFTNAGHHPALLISAKTGEIKTLNSSSSFLIGAFRGINFDSSKIILNEGDKILFFTDGIIEARRENRDFYEYDRFISFIKKNHKLTPKDFVEGLVKDVELFCEGRPQDDDRAILFVEFKSKLKPYQSIEDSIEIEARRIGSDKDFENNQFYKNLYLKAVKYVRSNEYEKALNLLLRLQNEFPENPKILNNLGISYYKLDMFVEAYRALEKAVNKDKQNEAFKKNFELVKEKIKNNI